MQLHIIAVGTRMPTWVDEGFNEYAKRLSSDFKIRLSEIPAEKRLKNSNLSNIMETESEKLWAAAHVSDFKIALDREGKSLNTLELAENLGKFRDEGRNISLFIGGPEGISSPILKKADALWSLSKLTLPHPLVRIVLAEQFYRAWSILHHHPYHR